MTAETTGWVQPPATQPTIVSDQMAEQERARLQDRQREARQKVAEMLESPSLAARRIARIAFRLRAKPDELIELHAAIAELNPDALKKPN